MEQEKINYSDIMDLGFNEVQCSDTVYESICGFPYCIITKDLTSDIYLSWEKETRFCYIIRLSEPECGSIGATREVKNLEQLKDIVDFFSNKK